MPFVFMIFDITAYLFTVCLFGAQRVMMISQDLSHLVQKFNFEVWHKFILDFLDNSQYHQNTEKFIRVFSMFIANTAICGKYFYRI